jgi:hypothetical protein
MIAKLTAKNQLTLPKSITRSIGDAEYFDVKVEDGQIIRADVIRARLSALDLSEQDISDAVTWARRSRQSD